MFYLVNAKGEKKEIDPNLEFSSESCLCFNIFLFWVSESFSSAGSSRGVARIVLIFSLYGTQLFSAEFSQAPSLLLV